MDKDALIESVESSLQALNSLPIDIISLLGTISPYVFSLRMMASIFLQKIRDADDSNSLDGQDLQAGNQLMDIIRLSMNTIQKMCSKTEWTDSIIKRDKSIETLMKLRIQLYQFIQQQNFTSILHAKIEANPFIAAFYNEIDYQLTLHTCYAVKFYLQRFQNDKFAEYNVPLTSLIDYLLNVRSDAIPKCLYWTYDGLEVSTLKDLRFLFPDQRGPNHPLASGGEAGLSYEEEADRKLNLSFHETYRGIWNGHFVAIQKISSKSVFQQGEIGLRECLSLLGQSVWKNSSYLLPLLGFSWERENLYFLYPLSVNRSLHDVLINVSETHKRSFSPIEKASILLDVCLGIEFLHSNGIVHGRLKDTNILLDQETGRAKLSDFGYQTFLTPRTRLEMKGIHGIRWLPPEIIRLESEFAQKARQTSNDATRTRRFSSPSNQNQKNKALSNQEYHQLENLCLEHGSFPLFPSTDIYAIGILVVVLLTEKIPFFNVPLEEGVKAQLVQGQAPYLPSSYPDQEILSPLLQEMYLPCTQAIPQRFSTEEVSVQVKQSYVRTVQRSVERDLQAYRSDREKVQAEIVDLARRITAQQTLITRGKEMIQRKEMEKLNMTDTKQRKERELEIQKARMESLHNQEELEGLREDREGAEFDLVELEKYIKEYQQKLQEDATMVLQNRPEMHPADNNQAALETYCDRVEIARIAPLFVPKAAGILPLTLGLVQTSPIASLFQPQVDLPHAEEEQVLQAVHQQQFRYQHLVDAIEILFRVPINYKALINNNSSSSSSGNAAPKKPPSILLQSLPEQQTSLSRLNPSRMSHPQVIEERSGMMMAPGDRNTFRSQGLVSTASEDSSIMGFRAFRGGGGGGGGARLMQEKDSDDDSDDEEEEDDEEGGGEEMPDEAIPQDEDYDSGPVLYREERLRSTRFFSTAPSQMLHCSKQELVQEIGTAWDLPISWPVVTAEELAQPYPTDKTDSLHIQYLAAARGDWDESVGLHRLQEGVPSEVLTAYLENQFTAVHLAAFLGNYPILVELIEQGGLNPHQQDSNGDTPLHCACKRGHSQIVIYLIETCHCSLLVPNQNQIIPILYALKGGFVEIVRFMMENPHPEKILPTYQDPVFGASLLHWACLSSRVELVEYLLLKQNLGIESKTRPDQMTCLHWACYNADVEVVQYLIEHAFANAAVKSQQGWSCLHFATASGSVEKASYLMDTVQLKLTDKDLAFRTPFDVAVGACLTFLQERKAKGFVTGSIAEKNRRRSELTGVVTAVPATKKADDED